MRPYLPMLLIAVAATPVRAQDVPPALDMGQLTGTLSQDHVTQTERARARGRVARTDPSRERARQSCGSARRMSAAGDTRPKIGTLLRMCARAGL